MSLPKSKRITTHRWYERTRIYWRVYDFVDWNIGIPLERLGNAFYSGKNLVYYYFIFPRYDRVLKTILDKRDNEDYFIESFIGERGTIKTLCMRRAK